MVNQGQLWGPALTSGVQDKPWGGLIRGVDPWRVAEEEVSGIPNSERDESSGVCIHEVGPTLSDSVGAIAERHSLLLVPPASREPLCGSAERSDIAPLEEAERKAHQPIYGTRHPNG